LNELQELRPKFVLFLSANGVDANNWEAIKEEDSAKAYELIDQFSDMVFSDVISRVEYLLLRLPNVMQEIRFEDQKAVMKGMQVKESGKLDLSANLSAEEMQKMLIEEGNSLQLISAERKYRTTKEADIFHFMEKGFLISKGDLFDMFQKIQSLQ